MIIEKIPFAGEIAIPENECEKQFFATFPDASFSVTFSNLRFLTETDKPSVFNQNDIALKIWNMAWSKGRIHTLEEVEAMLKKL